jgi:ParB family transcriptional regulator, chromosome partitioning protein
MSKKPGLGRSLNDLGLNALLSDISKTAVDNNAVAQSIRQLSIELLQPGKYQPRQNFDQTTLEDLANSIRSHGIIQPIVARPIATDLYEIIAGERRWRAAQLAGLQAVPVIIRKIEDEQASALTLIENLQREDLNVIDTAIGLKRLTDEFAMTHEAIANIIGKSRTTITNLLRLLSLHEEVKTMLKQGILEMGHARTLLTLDLADQLQAAKIIVAKKLSVRATEDYIRNYQQQKSVAVKKSIDPNIQRLQNKLCDTLGAKTNIYHTKSGKGKLVIHYHSLDELDGILDKIIDTQTEELLD